MLLKGLYKLGRILLLLALLLAPATLPAQRYDAVWNFGDSAGLDFTQSPPRVFRAPTIGFETSGYRISDASGNPLFYFTPFKESGGSRSDVKAFWDRTLARMPGQSAARMTPSLTNGFLILPVDSPATHYYPIYLSRVLSIPDHRYGDLSSSLIDMSQRGGLGALQEHNEEADIGQKFTEKLHAVRHANG